MTEEQFKKLFELHDLGWNNLKISGQEDDYIDLCDYLVTCLQRLPGFAKWRVIKILAKGNDIDE